MGKYVWIILLYPILSSDTIIVQNNSDSDVDVNFSYDKNTDNLDSNNITAESVYIALKSLYNDLKKL